MTARLKFSIVIPTCGRAGPLRECLWRLLQAVENATAANVTVEIIVSDDAGASDAELMEAFPGVIFIPGPMRGPAANRNHGARRATGEWLLFCDDDCLPDAGLLSVYGRWMQVQGCDVIEGAIFADRPRRHPFEESPINDVGGNLWSCNFAIRRSVFWAVGGFDERFPAPAGEDAELRYRLQKNGYRIQFVPEAFVIHPWRNRGAKGFLRQQKRLREADALAISIHPELTHALAPFNVVKDIARYYVRSFIPDVRRMGLRVLMVQPLLWWTQLQRFRTYSTARSLYGASVGGRRAIGHKGSP